MLQEIERGIAYANLGFNPMNNGETIIINVPPLTEERRRDLAKQAKAEAEDAKVSIRSARKDANNDIKKSDDVSEDLKANAEIDVQQMTDSYVKKVDDLFDNKEKEIMIPMNDHFISSIDEDAKVIMVELPEGLLNL